jgi:hypothetical protein
LRDALNPTDAPRVAALRLGACVGVASVLARRRGRSRRLGVAPTNQRRTVHTRVSRCEMAGVCGASGARARDRPA